MIRVFFVLILFFVGLPSFCEAYPQEMLKDFSKEYLDLYFSLPKEQRNDPAIEQWGKYSVNHNGPALNSKYAPDTTVYPFIPPAQQAFADYLDSLPND